MIGEYLLKKFEKKGCDDVIITSHESKNSQIKFSNSKITAIMSWYSEDIGIFVAKDKKLIATSIKDLTMKSADNAAQKIMKYLKVTPKNNEHYGIAKGPFKYKKIQEGYDKNIVNIQDNGIDIVKEVLDYSDAKKIPRSAGVFECSASKITLLTSGNVRAQEKETDAYLSFRALKTKEASGHITSCTRTLKHLDVRKVVDEASEIANMAVNPKSGPTGKFDLIFHPIAFSNILENAASSTSAFYVDSGLSCFAGKINKKVANQNITLYDQGNLENGFGSTSFDSEGVPTQKTTIIEKGILKTYLHNISTAKKFNTKTTANAGLIVPAPTNIVLEKGDYSKPELFDEVKNGIYVTNLWYTRFNNHSTGDFSTIPRDGAFLVKNGKITESIKDIRISDNLLSILKNVKSIGNDSRMNHGWEIETPVITPHVLVKNVNITKSAVTYLKET